MGRIIDLRGDENDAFAQLNATLRWMHEMRLRREQYDAQQDLAQKNYDLQKGQEDRLASNQSFAEAQTTGPQMVAQQDLENNLTPAAQFLMAQYNPATGGFVNGGMNSPDYVPPTQAAQDYAQLKTAGASQQELRAAALGDPRTGTGLASRMAGEVSGQHVAKLRADYVKRVKTDPGLNPQQREIAVNQATQMFNLLDQGIDKPEVLKLLIPNEIARDYAAMQKTLADVTALQDQRNSDESMSDWLRAYRPGVFGNVQGVIPGATKFGLDLAEIDHRASMERWLAEQKKMIEGSMTMAEGIKHFEAEMSKKIGDALEIVDMKTGALGLRPRMTVEQAFNETREQFARSGYFGLTPGLEKFVSASNNAQRLATDAAIPAVRAMLRSIGAQTGSDGKLAPAQREQVENAMVTAGWALNSARAAIMRATSEMAAEEKKKRPGRGPTSGTRKPNSSSGQLLGGRP